MVDIRHKARDGDGGKAESSAEEAQYSFTCDRVFGIHFRPSGTRNMKTLRKKLESMIVSGEGPSPIEYSVMVILLVAASVTVIAGTRQISHPYISRVPVQTTR